MSGLPREVIKWLQSLDLTHPIRSVRRDFSNGYLVAEVFAWYYPQEIQLHSFSNGASIQTKQGNWQQLERFFGKEKLDIPKEYIEGTIHCKPGAAHALLERAYALLTNTVLHYLPAKNRPQDFSDSSYQARLPPHARSTAAQAIKNNIASTELTTEPDRILCTQKNLSQCDGEYFVNIMSHCSGEAQAIMEVHAGQKRLEKEEFPSVEKNRRVYLQILSMAVSLGRFGLKAGKTSSGKTKVPKAAAATTATAESMPVVREIEVKQRHLAKVDAVQPLTN